MDCDSINKLEEIEEISYSSDLNDFKNNGIYGVHNHTHSVLNIPCGKRNFVFQVYKLYYIHQILLSESSMWIRHYNADDKKWYAWKRII